MLLSVYGAMVSDLFLFFPCDLGGALHLLTLFHLPVPVSLGSLGLGFSVDPLEPYGPFDNRSVVELLREVSSVRQLEFLLSFPRALLRACCVSAFDRACLTFLMFRLHEYDRASKFVRCVLSSWCNKNKRAPGV